MGNRNTINNSLINFYRDGNTYTIEVRDLDNASPEYFAVKTFSYKSDIEATQGDLLLLEDTVLISPHNKMLNLVDGVWYLNDFTSTTPEFRSVDVVEQGTSTEGVKAFTDVRYNSNTNLPQNCVVQIEQQTEVLNLDETLDTQITNTFSNYEAFFLENVPGPFPNPFPVSTRLRIQRTTVGDVGTIPFSISAQGVDFTYGDIKGGVDPFTISGNLLEQEQEYWYACRYSYFDGHKTNICFPKLVKTTNTARTVSLLIEDQIDINGEPCVVEVFRKRGPDNFFYIGNAEKVTNGYRFIDSNKPNLRLLDELPYVWTKKHDSHEIVRDRYVRANVEYYNPDFNIDATVITEQDGESEDYPINTTATIYARARYNDGTLSFHKEIGTINSATEDTKVTIDQQEVTSDREVKEVAYYLKHESVPTGDAITFDSIELFNRNLPSLATRSKEPIEHNRPPNTHIFLGWKYIVREFRPVAEEIDGQPAGRYQIFDYIIDRGLVNNESNEGNDNKIGIGFNIGGSVGGPSVISRGDIFPEDISYNIFGSPTEYVLQSVSTLNFVPNLVINSGTAAIGIYRLAIYDAINDGIRNQKIKIQIKNEKVFENNSLISGKELTPIGVSDESVFENTLYKDANVTINNVPDSKLHLIVDDEDLNNFSNQAAQSLNIVSGFVFGQPLQSTFSFDVLDVKTINTFTPESGTTEFRQGIYKNLIYLRRKNYILTKPDVPEGLAVLLSGSTYENGTVQLSGGYRKFKNSNLIFWGLEDYNIFETLITEDDLRTLKEAYPNQLIWSDPYIKETNSSGNRIFRVESFLNISRELGPIVSIKYINNNVLVFTTRGVAIVNVGEVLTQTATGETVVASENFLSSEQWGLKNLPDVQRNTIKQYENMIFFCDGRDVWMYNGQFGNISQGAVELARPATFNASIDPKNKEYRITDRDQTWAYNFEVGEWFGPYTYKDARNTLFKERFFSTKDGDLIEHNLSNLFWRKDYETIIRSVANDMQEPSIDKVFRKLYFDFEGDAEVSYGSEPRQSSEMKRKNGNYHLGIDRKMKNSKRLIWTIKTKAENFLLRMVSFEWINRNRR